MMLVETSIFIGLFDLSWSVSIGGKHMLWAGNFTPNILLLDFECVPIQRTRCCACQNYYPEVLRKSKSYSL